MKILIIDPEQASLDFSLRCLAAGHRVRVFMRQNKDGSRSSVGDGLIERVSHWEPYMNWADLIFCTDNTYYIHGLERFRDKGYPIFGPSIDTTKWEQDRIFGEEILDKVGIKTIPSQKFRKYDEAIAHVIKTNKRFVSKPVGDGNKALSYVAKKPHDLVYMLQKWKKDDSYGGEFILQEFRGGIEMAVGGWMGANGFSKWWCENWEFKKHMNNDLGVATGEQGTILRYTLDSLLAEKVLKPLEDFLVALGYTGYIDVNCIIDEQGTPWPLEFTMRPGWPLFQIQQIVHRGDPAQWMLDLVDGRDTLKVSEDVACGVVISIPDYPYCHLSDKETSGYPLFGLEMKDVITDVALSKCKWGKAPYSENDKVKLDVPMFVTAGSYVCTVLGKGKTVSEASENTKKTIKKKIEIPNSPSYRTDIGCRLEEQLPKLHSYGFCKDIKY